MARSDGVVEDGHVHAMDFQRTMHHACRNIDQEAFGQNEFFILQPEFNFAAQIAGVVEIGAEHGQDLDKVRSVRGDAGQLRRFFGCQYGPRALTLHGGRAIARCTRRKMNWGLRRRPSRSHVPGGGDSRPDTPARGSVCRHA